MYYMSNVYVKGTGGLGNSLFQISAAIYYCEKYNYRLILLRNETLLFGTSNMFDKKQMLCVDNKYITYDKTLLNKLTFVEDISPNFRIVHNDYTNNKEHTVNGKDIMISGYNQNIDLFRDVFSEIPKYFNLDDAYYNDYIRNKYGDIKGGTLICIRIGRDFSHMKKINKGSYLKALDFLKSKGEELKKIYVVSDIPIGNYFDNNNIVEIVESDIIQFYFGLQCKNYILSESTFHLWIAYLGTDFGKNNDKHVICFNNTDITNRHLDLPSFIKLDYLTA